MKSVIKAAGKRTSLYCGSNTHLYSADTIQQGFSFFPCVHQTWFLG